MEQLNICFFETYYGGSHKSFADGLVKNSSHDIELYTLPEKNYKWRIRGSALYLLENDLDIDHDILLVSDMFNVADYKALRGKKALPVINYFHENQITYPHNNSVSDFSLGMINITSALCSDKIIFNSHTHYNDFINSIPVFLDRAPDYKPLWVEKNIKDKCSILYPGCDFDENIETISINKTPLIIWNHRWDYDKKPESFFHLLRSLKENNVEFQVALLGLNYENKPKLFKKAEVEFKDNIVFSGFAKTKEDYINWLRKGDIVISTAIQENFGYSVVEAIHYGCFPILPNRLSYPEIVPEDYHKEILYDDMDELIIKTIKIIKNLKKHENMLQELSDYMKRYSWNNLINKYDKELRDIKNEN